MSRSRAPTLRRPCRKVCLAFEATGQFSPAITEPSTYLPRETQSRKENAMKTAGFTAELSLYQPSRHYRTSRHALTTSRQMNNLRLARAEEIEIFDCGPGFLTLGEGENTICIPD